MHSFQEYSFFALAQTDGSSLPFNNLGRTVRVVVEANVEAERLAVRFANYHGKAGLVVGAASLALCDEKGVLRPGTPVPLTVGGKLSFTLEAGESVLSDWAAFSLRPGQRLAVSLYYPTEERVTSGNRIDNLTLRSRAGNYCADAALPAPGLLTRLSRTVMASGATLQATSICEILAQSTKPHRAVACFGDSITQQGNWTVPLRKRLGRRFPGQVSLLNLGIGGNRLLRGAAPGSRGLYGPAGVQRFERDVMGLSGLYAAVLALGTNDIGLPGWEGTGEDEIPGLPEYAAAMEELAEKLHARGVRVYAATLAPRPVTPAFGEEREALRLLFNDWIRTAGCFDAVLDFDKALRRADGKPGMRDDCALPDGLHPSPLGGMWMAKSVDLSLFGGDGDER